MTATESLLSHPPSNFVGDEAIPLTGETIHSHNPARPREIVWSGSSDIAHVDQAVKAAHNALLHWAREPLEARIEVLREYQRLLTERADEFGRLISLETGKTLWESKQEAGALAGKVNDTLENGFNAAIDRVTGYETKLTDTRRGVCSFRPHGVMAVIGPFNFPAHLPNGHIVPALAIGNTVVFKPSDKTPAIGQKLVETLRDALRACSQPEGVVNLIQGAADIAQKLTTHDDLDGILFTGSWPVGRRILAANLDTPGRIVALELGGNNPAVVLDDADLRQAVIECARCAFITTGQRCTCTRRIIVQEGIADRFIDALCNAARALTVGDPAGDPPVFMGPIIREDARHAVIADAHATASAGGEMLVEPRAIDVQGCEGGHFITPGVVRVPHFTAIGEDFAQDAGCDVEVFGPFVRVSVVDSVDRAIQQANATRFGLAASIFTHTTAHIDQFLAESKAGCVNVNAGTAGASSKLPFGGLGLSGNHRPAGAFSLDYCAYPVASMVETGDNALLPAAMPWDDDWVK